ncbi:cytoplasm to vacuole targeting Vps64 [Purpureocillium lilacinum]|uniref:Cytoplasm to vacuole targeting Vps64 n=1 Tax=Purpureocillium lilacinum TaxID=33203 RepID=A0A179HJF2_PURLI|nr:cytoplasm to vacuole targeting Vps64 [Purpureocillium lilacinum]OAQ89711.1 cytoplasm to vacuole targeting Vps64 [Purpureocillium lilacinum]
MTAVASPPTFPQISRPAWGSVNGSTPMNPDEVRGMFAPRKQLSRTNSSSSVSSTSSNTTVATNGSQSNGTPLSAASDLSQWSGNAGPRKRPQPKHPWPVSKGEPQPDFSRLPAGRPNGMVAPQGQMQVTHGQPQVAPQQQPVMRPMPQEQFAPGQPVLYLLSLNGTFERKTIAVPFAPDSLRIGRQTNQKTIPTPTNGFFDSKVLSRQHAEIYAERNGKIYIRDVKSSNGTFVNGTRLSQENRESEPHELQTADHLELGIDIVSEDQKTVVHHKVAAKVEHAGFLSNTNNVMDMNFGDLDPANGTMLIPNGPLQMRGRAAAGAPMGNNGGRMMQNGAPMVAQVNGMAQQRSFFLAPIATDQILKRLSNEMRNARLQAQDLSRTNQFVHTLLSKDDVKDLEKPEPPEPPKPQPIVNGGGIQFRADPKARFSDPPAPPPQQPLPEKPDVPSLKRGPTERPKSGPPNPSPVRQENLNQIIQLTEALNNAKRDIDSQSARMRELEVMLQKEREARELAEGLARRLEENASSRMNGAAKAGDSEPEDEVPASTEHEDTPKTDEDDKAAVAEAAARADAAQETATALQHRIDTMDGQMRDMREQLESWRQRCEAAESERDAERKTLAEMVVQLRAEEAKRVAAEERRRSRSRESRSEQRSAAESDVSPVPLTAKEPPGSTSVVGEMDGDPTLSRANTITPLTSQRAGPVQDHHLHAGLPYASMLGVVLIGMGLMAYINGWQSPPSRLER